MLMEKDDKSIKMSQKKVNVSIICASTNGKIKLPNLVRSISQGSYIPKELIIVGTSLSDKQLLLKYLNKNINFKFLVSKKKNQIFQRNIAKKVSKYDLILQTDDDVIFHKNTLKEFYYNWNHLPIKKILAAFVINEDNLHLSTRFTIMYKKFFLFRLILSFLNNFKKIKNFSLINSGRIVPLIEKKISRKYQNLDWLNSVMMYNKKSVFEPKITNIGKKSYYEDVIFSHYNKLKGFNLIILRDAKVTHPTTQKTSFKIFIETVTKQFYLVKLLKKNYLLFFFDVMIFAIIFLIYK